MEVVCTQCHKWLSVKGRLWTISMKLAGLGELIKGYSGEPPLDPESVYFGIGQIVADLSKEIGGLSPNAKESEY